MQSTLPQAEPLALVPTLGSALLREMSYPDLQVLLLDLRKQRAELIAEKTEIRRQWLCDKKPTSLRVRAEVCADLTSVQAEISAVELEMSNWADREKALKAKKEEEKHARLQRWQWSDQMLAALQHICEQNGNGEYITTARAMTAKGWPHTE